MSKLSVTKVADVTSLAATSNYAFKAEHHKVRAVQAVWTATTAAFTLTLQYSLDNSTWQAFTTATAITDASGNVMWDVADSKDGFYWRVLATRTSGTLTTLKAYFAYVQR